MQSNDVVIRVENLWKRYGTTLTTEAKRMFHFRRGVQEAPEESHGPWALRNINFELRQGEILGVIGRNGSGKSTLLKQLAGVTPPTHGNIEIRGRVFPMIELNAGMHTDLTGRQNVQLLGAVMGFHPDEMRERIPGIARFCELEDWFDKPLWMYSSGMLARLGFAVAVNVDADVLLIDEVLAVGDLSFQRKCYRHMEQLHKGGVTTIFVSHSARQVERLCSEVMLLERGKIIKLGDPMEVCHLYMQSVTDDSLKKMGLSLDEAIEDNIWEGSGEVIVTKVRTLNSDGRECNDFLTCEPLVICVEYEAKQQIKDPIIGITFYTADMLLLAGFSNEKASIGMSMDGKSSFSCEISSIPMLSGVYSIGVLIKGRDNSLIYGAFHLARFNVGHTACAKQSRGFVHIEPQWNFNVRE